MLDIKVEMEQVVLLIILEAEVLVQVETVEHLQELLVLEVREVLEY